MLAIFRKFLALFICVPATCLAQIAANSAIIELGPSSFPIERPFTISVILPTSETRPVLTFPDIPGLTKKGILTTVSAADNGGKAASQIITQNYQAQVAGRFMLAPFTITVNGEVLSSEGAVLVVRPSATVPTGTTLGRGVPALNGTAFLAVRASKSVIYTGEGVGLTLSFFVADNYPYELSFTALDRQLQAITKKIRPANAWEENRPITELKPVSVSVGGRKFREVVLYQSVFFPLAARPLSLPAVTLYLSRPRPKIGPPSSEPERVAFTTKPVVITVRPLPPHPLRGQVAVGEFGLNEQVDQPRVGVGQSVRYSFTVEGEGNVATLPAPTTSAKMEDVDIFPPEERHIIRHDGNQTNGQKTFTYFIVPRQKGVISLANHFQWIYFNPQRARYDTLRPRLQLRAGGEDAEAMTKISAPAETSGAVGDTASVSASGRSLYAGLDVLDSTRQPISIPVLIRAVANVLIVLMILGMIFVFFKK